MKKITLNKFLESIKIEPTYATKKKLIYHLEKYEEATGEVFIHRQKNGLEVKINAELLTWHIPSLLDYK